MKLYIKLNIQRFATTVTSNAYETGVDTNNNLSYVYATFTQVSSSNTWNTSGSAYYNISCDGKSTGNVSYTFSKGSTKTFSATLGPYYHNADGTLGAKTVTIVVHGDVSGGNHTQTHTVTFTTIPRDFSSTPSISFRSKTDKKIVYNWSTSETCDLIKYHLDGGSAQQVWTGSATSGTFEVSGLTGGTTHSVYADFRRKDSQRSLPSNTVSNITTYKTPTLSLSNTAVDETSLTIKATPNVAIKSKSWTLKNSGGTTIATSTSTNESVTFNNLSANTSYKIYVYCVSNDANGAITSTTYDATYKTTAYPTVNRINTAELVIGNSQTINISNPKNRTVTVFMKQNASDSDANALYSGTTNVNGDFTFTPTASTLYNKIPAAHNSNCVYYVKYGTNASATVSGKFKIKETETPTFTTNNWNYTVSNTYNALTGNDNKVVIAGYSTVNFTVSSAATSAYGATFTGSASGYVYNWGTGTIQLTKTTTAFISGFNSNVIKVTASDDRGLSTVAARTLTNGVDYVNYAPPTSITASTHRANGIDTATTLTLTGKLGYVGKFGTNGVTNTIASIKYKTKAASSSTWSSEYNLTGYTVDTSTGDFSLTNAQIHQNGSTGGFPVGTKYNVMIIVKDAQGLLGSTTYQVDVTDGKIARDVYQDSNGEYHEGINGRADSNYTQKINGSLNVTGNETVGGALSVTGNETVGGDETITGALSVAKTSTNYNGGAIPGTKQANATTVGGLLDEVRMTNGQMGSVTINTAYTSNNITIATGWYNYLYIPHRTGGSSGSASGDNCNYGNLILVGMTSDTPVYLVRKASNTTQVSRLSKNLVKASVSAKSHTDYNNNQDYLPTMNFLTYWNGAYNSSNSSNLTYCTKGAFGDACVKAVTTSVTENSAALLTSGGAFTAFSKYNGSSFNSNSCSISYYKKGNVCSVRMNIYEDHTFAGWANTTIATLPAGYRPLVTMTMGGQVQEDTTSHFYVLADGKINLFNWAGQKKYYGGQFEMSVTYVIG